MKFLATPLLSADQCLSWKRLKKFAVLSNRRRDGESGATEVQWGRDSERHPSTEELETESASFDDRRWPLRHRAAGWSRHRADSPAWHTAQYVARSVDCDVVAQGSQVRPRRIPRKQFPPKDPRSILVRHARFSRRSRGSSRGCYEENASVEFQLYQAHCGYKLKIVQCEREKGLYRKLIKLSIFYSTEYDGTWTSLLPSC